MVVAKNVTIEIAFLIRVVSCASHTREINSKITKESSKLLINYGEQYTVDTEIKKQTNTYFRIIYR